MWWLVGLIVTAAGAAYAAVRKTPSTSYVLPKHAKTLVPAFQRWAENQQIPTDVLLAWAKLESNFDRYEYNPERGVLQKWSCEVASDARWKVNPDYEKARRVCQLLSTGASPDSILAADKNLPFAKKAWTFGSIGILQVSRRYSPGWGYAYAKPNAGLFDLETNLRVGTTQIAKKRQELFPGRVNLTDDEWSRVRAAYVMGVAGSLANPEGAALKQAKFLRALAEIRGAPVA